MCRDWGLGDGTALQGTANSAGRDERVRLNRAITSAAFQAMVSPWGLRVRA
jgi:hypothetical protein